MWVYLTEVLMKQMAEKQGVNENLKRQDQMKWVGLMNKVKASAEVNITVRQSRQSGVARATCPD